MNALQYIRTKMNDLNAGRILMKYRYCRLSKTDAHVNQRVLTI